MGGAILAICVWIVVSLESLVNTLSFMAPGMIFVGEKMVAVYILIGFGFLLTFLSIIGCIGASKRTTLLLALVNKFYKIFDKNYLNLKITKNSFDSFFILSIQELFFFSYSRKFQC